MLAFIRVCINTVSWGQDCTVHFQTKQAKANSIKLIIGEIINGYFIYYYLAYTYTYRDYIPF